MKQKIVIVCICMIIAVYVTFPKQEEPVYVYQHAEEVTPIAVSVSGEVNLPDTYYFFNEPSVYDVIQMAGGLTANADESTLTFSQLILEPTSIVINASDDELEEKIDLVNINEASFAALLDIPYMSESRAAYIIMYRETHGDFQSLEDLIHVKYIGAATLENLRPYLSVS